VADGEVVGPISKAYHTLHTIGQKMPIPEIDETKVKLPEFVQVDQALDAGSVGLSGMILEHYRSGMVKAGLRILRSSAAWSEVLSSASESSHQRIKRQNEKASKLSAGSAQGGVSAGLSAVGSGVWEGLSGAVLKPFEGAYADGVTGFFSGIRHGAVGAVTKPMAGMVAGTKIVNDTYLKEARDQKLVRMRPPRAVFGDRLLRSFDEDNAATFLHLQTLETQLRKEGAAAKADVIASLKHNYMGYARLAKHPRLGLLLTLDKLVLVEGFDFAIQREILMTDVREAKAMGQECLYIVTKDQESTTLVLHGAAWAHVKDMSISAEKEVQERGKKKKLAVMQETILPANVLLTCC
jgi:hypothetical protein